MLAAEIALGKREFVYINQIDMETQYVDSTTLKDAMLPQNSPFNDLEGLVAIQPETPQNTRTQMLPENYPFNDMETGLRMLVEMNPETPQITTTQMLTENSQFKDLEDRKLRKPKPRGIMHPMQRQSQDKKIRVAKNEAWQKQTSNRYI